MGGRGRGSGVIINPAGKTPLLRLPSFRHLIKQEQNHVKKIGVTILENCCVLPIIIPS